MQYYRDGFHPGDPTIAPSDAPTQSPELEDEVDVLIVGTGPAGLTLAAQLSQFPEFTTRIVERRDGPLELGQADGIACRTVETFETFGLAAKLLEESYWVNETSFWRPDPSNRARITRTGRIQDVEDDLSEFPHVIVNQARIHDYLLGAMERSPSRLAPNYGFEFVTLTVDREDPATTRPVTATLRDIATGGERTVRARYVVGCDGARSGVRQAIGRELRGDKANHAWGVMDVLAVTDFPDIRLKAAIQSADEGSILIIPREGGYLVRLYVDLGTVTDENRETIRGMGEQQIAEVANRVLHPYSIDIKETAWFSVYEVAQRVTDAFDDAAGRDRDPRVFIAGDACHTHSAKAGQGMNVSIQDAFNLGWKLAAVLRGRASPSLLETYSEERQPVAQHLIDFDREWSAMLAAPPKDPAHPERDGVDPAEVQEYFVRQGRYTAGFGTHYPPSRLTGTAEHQGLATGLEIGTRFHSAPVTRIADAMRTELGHAHRADGRFRMYVFADASETRFGELCAWLEHDPASPLVRHAPEGADIDAVIDVRGILQRPHREADVNELPSLMRPRTGSLGLIDQEKAFSSVTRSGDFFEARGLSREGCAVVVRPDQYIAAVLPLEERDGIAAYFAGVLS